MIFIRTFLLLPALLLILTGMLPPSAAAAPTAELWPRWQANAPQSQRHIDHSTWAEFLKTYLQVSGSKSPNLVRYAAVTTTDKEELNAYLARLFTTPVAKLNRAEQKAYWINLYNALTVRTILTHYPLKSIRDIKSGWFNAGPWDLKLATVDGIKLSLNDIEHHILRPLWRDNRIHYAVNCASYSCPNLQPEPFTAANTERLLNQAAHAYVNSPRGVRFEGKTLMLSSIYDWYQVDFGGNEVRLVTYLKTLATPALAEKLDRFHGTISYRYNWELNGK